jgi:hypothetical protein
MSIQAAAERLRQDAQDIVRFWNIRQRVIDHDGAASIAEEYLRLTNPTPLSITVLKQVGFEEVPQVRSHWQCGTLLVGDYKHERCWFVREPKADRQLPSDLAPRTLGELRQLANRLGIPLKETE